jgi:hypothetical protein
VELTMDPHANINEQRALVASLLDGDDYIDTGDAVRLAELVLALDQWRTDGGFDPYLPTLPDDAVPNHAQALALGRFLRGHFQSERVECRIAHVTRGGMGLNDSYLGVRFGDGYEGGIAPDGSTST